MLGRGEQFKLRDPHDKGPDLHRKVSEMTNICKRCESKKQIPQTCCLKLKVPTVRMDAPVLSRQGLF